MKTINLATDLGEFHTFFKEVKKDDLDVIIWQLDPDTQKRKIFHSKISLVGDRDNKISLNTINDEAYQFDPQSLYFYIESRMSIFKAEQISIQNNFLEVRYPDELKMLDEMEDDKIKAVFSAISSDYVKVPPSFHELAQNKDKGYTFVAGASKKKEAPEWQKASGGGRKDKIETMWKGAINNYNAQSDRDKAMFEEELSFVTLDEEDKIYEGQRNAPRAKPPEGKMVIVQMMDESKPQETLPLFDLSRGGLGFFVFSSQAYAKGDVILIKGFDTNKFDEPMLMVVRSVREADEMGIQYKVGGQFISAMEAADLTEAS